MSCFQVIYERGDGWAVSLYINNILNDFQKSLILVHDMFVDNL